MALVIFVSRAPRPAARRDARLTNMKRGMHGLLLALRMRSQIGFEQIH